MQNQHQHQKQNQKQKQKNLSAVQLNFHKIFKYLSVEAQKIVFTYNDEKNIRVVAGAGAGKTEVLTLRIIYLLITKKALPKHIVAFTFTDKAAKSLQSRIYRRIQEFEDQNLVNQLSEMYIGTIHGFCKRLLKDVYEKYNYEILDEIKEKVFIHEIGEKLGLNLSFEEVERKFHVVLEEYENNKNNKKKKEYKKDKNKFIVFRKFIQSHNIINNEEIDSDRLSNPKFKELVTLIVNYERMLKENQLITFGQLIRNAIVEIKQKPDPLKDIRFLFVDEYQDINRAQEHLIQLLGQKYSNKKKSPEIFVVGDPKQSIYNWRGSDLQCFNNFKNLIPGKSIKSFNILINYRSTEKIVNHATEFANSTKINNFNIKQKTYNKESSGMVIGMTFENPWEEAKNIIKQIKYMVEKNDNTIDIDKNKDKNINYLNYSDFAILCRSVRISANPFIKECIKQKIPYIVGGKVGLLRHKEIEAVACFMMWLSEDGYWIARSGRNYRKIFNDNLLNHGLDKWFKAKEENKIMQPNLRRKIDLKGPLKRWKENSLKKLTLPLQKNQSPQKKINNHKSKDVKVSDHLALSGIENFAGDLDLSTIREVQTSETKTQTQSQGQEQVQLQRDIFENSEFERYLKGETYFDIFNDLLYILGVRDFDLTDPYHATMFANFGRFSQILNDFEFIRKLNGKELNLLDKLPHLNDFILNFKNIFNENEMNENQFSHALHIYTINQAKGLEWPVVFIPSIVKNRFPTSYIGKDLKNFLTLKKEEKIPFDMHRYKTKFEDEARLFYVAETRAKNIVVFSRYSDLSDPEKAKKYRSEFLEHLGRNMTFIKKNKMIADHCEFPDFNDFKNKKTSLEIDEFSITEILDFAKCPYLYKFRHEWKFGSRLNRFLGYGHALHHILQKIVSDKKIDLSNERELREKLKFLMKTDFRLPYLDTKINALIRKGAFHLIHGYISKFAPALSRMKSVETRLELVEKNAIIKGIADIVLRDDSQNSTGTRVWDYKTKKMGLEEINQFQILLYCAALDEMGYSINSGAIAYLKEQKNVPISITKKALKQVRIQVNGIVDKIREKNFKCSFGTGKCNKSGCDQYKICHLSDYNKTNSNNRNGSPQIAGIVEGIR